MDARCGDSSVDGWDGDRNVGNVGGSDWGRGVMERVRGGGGGFFPAHLPLATQPRSAASGLPRLLSRWRAHWWRGECRCWLWRWLWGGGSGDFGLAVCALAMVVAAGLHRRWQWRQCLPTEAITAAEGIGMLQKMVVSSQPPVWLMEMRARIQSIHSVSTWRKNLPISAGAGPQVRTTGQEML